MKPNSTLAPTRSVSTHSRPKAAGVLLFVVFWILAVVSTHSRPKAAGSVSTSIIPRPDLFQHTAARRRLETAYKCIDDLCRVSTHSRPKAAGLSKLRYLFPYQCFNTQPPEGGWLMYDGYNDKALTFQHTAARRRLDAKNGMPFNPYKVSTHSRPKAAGT